MSHLLPGSITALQDTTISSITAGQVLVWSGSAWINQDPTTATSFNITGEGSNSFSVADSDTVNFSSGGAFTFDTSTADTVSLDFSVSPTTGGTSQQVMIFDDNTDSYSWGAPISIASGSSSYLSYDNATRELSVSNLLITDVTTNAALSITAYVATTPTHQSGDIVILPSASAGAQTWIHNGGSAGTIADYTQILDGASMSSFQFQADTGSAVSVTNGATIKVLGGTGLASSQGTAGEITIDFSAAPTTGGSTKQILQFDDTGDTFSWVDQDTVGEILTFSNGLTRTLDDVELGGTLTSNTTIGLTQNSFELIVDRAGEYIKFRNTDEIDVNGSLLGGTLLEFNVPAGHSPTYMGLSSEDPDFFIASGDNIVLKSATGSLLEANSNSVRVGYSTDDIILSSNNGVSLETSAAKAVNLTGYGVGNKEATDLSLTASAYVAGFATVDGSIIDVPISSLENITASNGLTRTVDDIELGGALTSATKIEVSSGNTLQVSDGTSANGWMFPKAPDESGLLTGLSSPDLFLEFTAGSVATSLGSFGSTFYFTTTEFLKIQSANNLDIESTEAVTIKGGDGVFVTGLSSNVSISTQTSGNINLNSAAGITNTAATGIIATATTGDITTTATTGKIDFTAATTSNIEAAGNIGIDSTAGDITLGVITGSNTIDIAAAGDSEAKLTSATGVVTVGASGAGTLVHQGAQVFPCSTKTANYTMVKGDYVILADGSSAVVTITLPASPQNGHIVNIKCIDDTNAVSITTPSTETIDGLSTHTFNYQYESVTLVSDGSNWSIL